MVNSRLWCILDMVYRRPVSWFSHARPILLRLLPCRFRSLVKVLLVSSIFSWLGSRFISIEPRLSALPGLVVHRLLLRILELVDLQLTCLVTGLLEQAHVTLGSLAERCTYRLRYGVFGNFRLSQGFLHSRCAFRHNRHKFFDLNLKANPLDSFFDNFECEEGDLFVDRIHDGFRHLLDHVLVALLVVVRDDIRIHNISYSIWQALVDILKIHTKLLKLICERLLIVRHVEESLRRCINEAILLPNSENILIQTEFLEVLIADTTNLDALRSLDIRVSLRVLVEQVTNLKQLFLFISTVLITEKFVQSL